MLTKIDYARAKDIVAVLSIPGEIGPEEDGSCDNDWLLYQLGEGDISAQVECGISKVVIIPEDGNFVIKIPFNGMYHYNWNEDDEDDYGDSEFEYYYYACAPDHSDYCWDEVIKIEKAYEMGYGKLFPDTKFLQEKDGHRVYIQEKVRTARYFNPNDISEDSRKKAESMGKYYKKCDNTWRAAVVEFYGESYWKDFCDWDYLSDVNILSDMHADNYGYDMNGYPIILDASGFRDQEM